MEVYGEVARENVAVAAEAVDAAQLAEAAEVQPGRRASLWRDAGRRLLRNKLAVAGLIGVCVLVFLAAFADVISPYPYDYQDFLHINEEPSWQFPLGTDLVGRDMLSRVIYGARVSLYAGVVSVVLIALPVGTVLGVLAGYFRGWVDTILSRIVDVMFAFPSIILAIAIVGIFGASLTNAMIAIGIVYTPQFARLVRGAVLAIREQEFVEAARALGAGPIRVLGRHVLPNILSPIIVVATLTVGFAIVETAGLSFLGLGASPPTPEWGSMLATGRSYMLTAPWIATFPGLAILVTVVAFNLMGDGLRDLLDPRLRGRGF